MSNPRQQGRDAYCEDLSLSDNPYSPGDPAYNEWRTGFLETEANDPLAPAEEDDTDDDDDGLPAAEPDFFR